MRALWVLMIVAVVGGAVLSWLHLAPPAAIGATWVALVAVAIAVREMRE